MAYKRVTICATRRSHSDTVNLPSRFNPAKLLPRRERRALLLLLVLAVLLRLPFYFTSTDGYVRDGALTFHDEAVFMALGLEVLQGNLPYLSRWDALPPLGWLASAVMMLLSWGSLPVFRLLGTLYIGVTAYVLFRGMADRGRRAEGAWAAVFYLLLASTLQAGQSFLPEQLRGLPLVGVRYILLNPREEARQRWRLLALFGVCGLLSLNALLLAPVVAMLYPALFRGRLGSGSVWLAGWQMLVRCALLLAAVCVGHLIFYVPYLLCGEGQLLLATLLDAPDLLRGNLIHPWAFARRYVQKMAYSEHWLLVVCGFIFLLKLGKQLLLRQTLDRLFLSLCGLMLAGLGMVYLRGNHGNLFMFYFLQVLPVFALMMGITLRFDYDEARWFVAGAVVLALVQMTLPLQAQYVSLVQYMSGDNSHHESWRNDRLYRVAKVMQTFPTKGESLIVCGEDDMLYVLTDMVNPRYFLFPFNHYDWPLHKLLQRQVPTLRQEVVRAQPLYIVGRDNDALTKRGFSEISDILQQKYIQVAKIEGTIVYLRQDILRGFSNKQ